MRITTTTRPLDGGQDKAATSGLLVFILAYSLFILAGSLYPFVGWTHFETPTFAFLNAPWPKFITRTDLVTNLLSYAPLGYASSLWFSQPGHRLRGMVLGVMAGTLLSLFCEAMQQFLPTRIASNLDILVNSLGVMIGALLAIHHIRWLRAGAAIKRWRKRWFHEGMATNVGIGLLCLWVMTQFALVPISGGGWLHLHLRPLDTPPESLAGLNSAWFLAMFIEVIALGAFSATLLKPGRYVGGMVLVSFVAFLIKLVVATVLLKLAVVGGVLSLETLTAFVLAFWILLLPTVSRKRRQIAVAACAMIIIARWVLAERFMPSASVLNIVGLAKHLATLWPVLVLVWLTYPRVKAPKPVIP